MLLRLEVNQPMMAQEGPFRVVECPFYPGTYLLVHRLGVPVAYGLDSLPDALALARELQRLALADALQMDGGKHGVACERVKGILEGPYGHSPWLLFGLTRSYESQWKAAIKAKGGQQCPLS